MPAMAIREINRTGHAPGLFDHVQGLNTAPSRPRVPFLSTGSRSIIDGLEQYRLHPFPDP